MFERFVTSYLMSGLLAAVILQSVALNPAPLPSLRIDPQGISISGLSSGADFAAQFQVILSGQFPQEISKSHTDNNTGTCMLRGVNRG